MKLTALRSGLLISAIAHASVLAGIGFVSHRISHSSCDWAGKEGISEFVIIGDDDSVTTTPEIQQLGHIPRSQPIESTASDLKDQTTHDVPDNVVKEPLLPETLFAFEDQLPPFDSTSNPNHESDPADPAAVPVVTALDAPAADNSIPADGDLFAGKNYQAPALQASEKLSGEGATRASYLTNPEPRYPTKAVRLRQEGLVILSLEVTKNGLPDGIRVSQSSGFELLDEAALKAIQRWRFRPALNGSEPVSSQVEIPVHFKITKQ